MGKHRGMNIYVLKKKTELQNILKCNFVYNIAITKDCLDALFVRI